MSNQKNPLTDSHLQTPIMNSLDNICVKKEDYLNNDTYMIDNDFQNRRLLQEDRPPTLNYQDYKVLPMGDHSEQEALNRLAKRNNKIYSRSIISHSPKTEVTNHAKSFSRSRADHCHTTSHTKLYDQLKLLKNEKLSSIQNKSELMENMRNRKKVDTCHDRCRNSPTNSRISNPHHKSLFDYEAPQLRKSSRSFAHRFPNSPSPRKYQSHRKEQEF